MKFFDWRYAVDKLLVFLTSTKNLAVVAGAVFAIFGLELSVEVQGFIAIGSGVIIAVLKLVDDVIEYVVGLSAAKG